MSNNFTRRIGFTLAEVLITLGIIGIVAEMTIPTLTQNVQEQTFKVGLKKAFSTLSQATTSIMYENSGSMVGACGTGDSDCLMYLYKEYLNSSKYCTNGASGCFWSDGTVMKYLSGAYTAGWGADAGLVLNDGSFLNIWMMSSDCTTTFGSTGDNCGSIYYDINGAKKPNTIGKDIFVFHIKAAGIVPAGGALDPGFNCTTHGHACAYGLLYN